MFLSTNENFSPVLERIRLQMLASVAALLQLASERISKQSRACPNVAGERTNWFLQNGNIAIKS